MDALDRKILDLIQNDFPITSSPYTVIAKQVDSSEAEVLKRIRKLKDEKIIRRIGGIFDSPKLGYHSVLVAAKVTKSRLEETVAILNRYTGITHNYQREHEFNVWFTLTASSEMRLTELLEQIRQTTGIREMYPLPSLKKYKIRVHFNMTSGT